MGCTPDDTPSGADNPELMRQIREHATAMLDKGEMEGARAYYDSAFASIDSPGVGDYLARFSFIGGEYYGRINEPLESIEYLDSLLALLPTPAIQGQYFSVYTGALFLKGDRLFDLGKYNLAYESYFKGKLAAEKKGDPCALSECIYRLGMVNYKQERYFDAADRFKESLKVIESCPASFDVFARTQELLNNTSISLGKLNQIDSALAYSHRALEYINRESPKYPSRSGYAQVAKAVIYGNQSNFYLNKGKYGLAEALLLKSIAINTQKGYDNFDAQTSMIKLGELYYATNQSQKIVAVLTKLKASLDSLYDPYVEQRYVKLKSDYYLKNNQQDSAYVYLKKYQRLQSSSDSVQHQLYMADLDKEFQHLRQKSDNQELQQANELKKVWLYLALSLLAMALLILFLIWRNWRLSRQNLSKLENLNVQISIQNTKYEQTLKELKRSSEEKDRILKVVAHDLRSPIGAIASISSILLDEAQFDEEQLRMATMIKDLSWQSMDMIRDVLSNSIGPNTSELRIERVDMVELAQACVDQIRFKAEEKKQNIYLEVLESVSIEGDREKLTRVLVNLLVNAIKFSPSHSAITVILGHADGKMRLEVADKGIGIPDEISSQLFDTNAGAQRSGTQGEKSYGIGLPFSKEVVTAHQGNIWFESHEGVGSQFFIEIPFRQNMDVENKS
ncbi:tetratricopeptide repeat-containing sensor histidine kinase [Dyadobacter tibetensis]|uniref:tetratricopeptide repeat-containing sensor histidine kinase n=1 Tax=Dyadobacter tibetensis TaxID=1211851 RepID=UPI00047032A6|nr:HAMP domain-containing sensor histidine kinase [Dyadobacter tibetensis]